MCPYLSPNRVATLPCIKKKGDLAGSQEEEERPPTQTSQSVEGVKNGGRPGTPHTTPTLTSLHDFVLGLMGF